MSRVKIEFYGIKLDVFVTEYGDGTYDLDCFFVCNDNWVSGQELPSHFITDRAEQEIYSLVGEALIKDDDFDCDAVGSCVWGEI